MLYLGNALLRYVTFWFNFHSTFVFSNLNSLHKNTVLRWSCLFNHNLSLSFRNKTVCNEICFYCTYSIKTKTLSMLDTGYFLKIAKITALFINTWILKFKSQLTFAFFAAVNHLSAPLRKQKFTSTGSKGHGLWLADFDPFCALCVSWRFVTCDRY